MTEQKKVECKITVVAPNYAFDVIVGQESANQVRDMLQDALKKVESEKKV